MNNVEIINKIIGLHKIDIWHLIAERKSLFVFNELMDLGNIEILDVNMEDGKYIFHITSENHIPSSLKCNDGTIYQINVLKVEEDHSILITIE